MQTATAAVTETVAAAMAADPTATPIQAATSQVAD